MKRSKRPAPILDPAFVWIPAASHDADSTAFRERQRARMIAAQTKPEAANVSPLARKVKT